MGERVRWRYATVARLVRLPRRRAVTTSARPQGHVSSTVQRSTAESVHATHQRATAALIARAAARGAAGVIAVSVAYLDHATLTLTALLAPH